MAGKYLLLTLHITSNYASKKELAMEISMYIVTTVI